jgi:hypothetical protein
LCGAQTAPDDKIDAADHPPVINPRNSVRQRKIRFDPAHPRLGEHKQIGHRGISQKNANESVQTHLPKKINGS